jgi:hypothetical protein
MVPTAPPCPPKYFAALSGKAIRHDRDLFGLRRSGRSNDGTNVADQTVHVTALYAVFCVIGVDTCNLRVDLSPEGRIWTNKSAGSHTHTNTNRRLLRCSIAEKISCFLGGISVVDARCESAEWKHR